MLSPQEYENDSFLLNILMFIFICFILPFIVFFVLIYNIYSIIYLNIYSINYSENYLKIFNILKDNEWKLFYVINKFKYDENLFLQLTLDNYKIFKHIPKRIIKNKQFILKILEERPTFIFFKESISHFFYDKEMVIKFMFNHGHFFPFLPIYFRNDEEIINLSISRYYQSFNHCPAHLKNNKEFALKHIKENNKIYESLNDDLKSDKDILDICLTNSGYLLKKAPQSIQEDFYFIKLAVKSYPYIFESAPFNIRSDILKVIEILEINEDCYKYVSANFIELFEQYENQKPLQILKSHYQNNLLLEKIQNHKKQNEKKLHKI